jgi:ABC-type branched-subunit amino acid transport system substrate-binding protein
MSRSRTLVAALSSVVLALTLASCAPATRIPQPTRMPQPTRTATARPDGNGVLRIGTLFPSTGAQSYLGGAQAAGVAVAVAEINAAGGVNGKPVEVVARDSGDATTGTIEASLADLLATGVDVVVGPSSSVLAERIMPKIVAAKIPMISPAATSVRLSSIASRGYFFRTIASTALEGSALAASIGGGKATVALVYLDDDMGRAILDTLRASLAKSGGSLVTAQKFVAATTDFAPIVAAVKAAAPDAVALVSPFSAMGQNTAVITQLTAAGLGGAKLWLTSENTADYSQALPAGVLTGVNGLLEGADPDAAFAARVTAADPSAGTLLYSPEAYDATILAALAATVAKDDGGAAIARRLRDVSSGGIKCTTFAECLDVLKTRSDIDYDGISGPIAFDGNGDTAPADFGIYRYDTANRFARVGDAIGG